MTGRMEKFVLEYAQSRNGTRAALAAGYSKAGASSEAHRLLRNPKVREKLNQIDGESATKASLSRKEWLERIVKLCSGQKPAIAIKALELYGKAQGMFEPDKVQHSGEMTEIHRLDDESLKNEIRDLDAKIAALEAQEDAEGRGAVAFPGQEQSA